MASESGHRGEHIDGVDVGLLFISKTSGQDLIDWIIRQSPESKEAGGPRLLLDGFTRWIPGEDGLDPLTWMGTILLSLGCLLSCTCLFVSESIREAGNNQVVAIRRRDRAILLTEEEVRTLPEIVFREDGDDKPAENEDKDAGGDKKKATETAKSDVQQDVVEKTHMTTPLLEASASSLPEAAEDAVPPTSSLVNPSPLRANFDNTSCSICLEEYHDGCRLRVLPCHHAFHSDCIMPWLTRRSPTCPLCKAEFEGAGGDSDDEDEESSIIDGEGDADADDEEAGTRVVASMLGIDLEAATSRGPPMVRQRIPQVSDDEESDVSSVGAGFGGFWRFVFGRRRLQDEEASDGRQEEAQELAPAASDAPQQEQQQQQQDELGEEEEDNTNTSNREEQSRPRRGR